ncbi:MAG: DUF2332 family protein [Paracoccaceae bacterium]
MTWRDAFADQAQSCESLGSPFTARLLSLIATRGLPDGRVLERIAGWPGDITSRGASVPLRLAGALHGLVLEGRAPDLDAHYPPATGADEPFWRAVSAAVTCHADWIDQRLDAAPQTNEVGRAAFLIAAGRWLQSITGLPLCLSELGASAGLNLMFDRFALDTGVGLFGPADPVLTLRPDWRGDAPMAGELRVVARAGVDLAPPDPIADRLRLLSFLWPDQPERMTRMRAALAEAERTRLHVERADAIDFLARRLADPPKGAVHVVFHTVAWQYFPDDAKTRGMELLTRAGARATRDAPLAHVAMEADGKSPGAGCWITLWPKGTRQDVGRIDFHGRWIDWRPPSEQEFAGW